MREENEKEVAISGGDQGPKSLLANTKIENGSLVLTSGDQLWWFAGSIVRGGLAPKGMEKQETVFLAIIAGMELGLDPMKSMRGIMVVNNRTAVWGDVALALCMASPKCGSIKEWIEGEGENAVAICECIRIGWDDPVRRTFSYEWAKKAGLLTKEGAWTKYPIRMLQNRARGFALRDTFADVLQGMVTVEEAMDYVDTTATVVESVETEEEAGKARIEAEALKAAMKELNALTQEYAVGSKWIQDAAKMFKRPLSKLTASELLTVCNRIPREFVKTAPALEPAQDAPQDATGPDTPGDAALEPEAPPAPATDADAANIEAFKAEIIKAEIIKAEIIKAYPNTRLVAYVDKKQIPWSDVAAMFSDPLSMTVDEVKAVHADLYGKHGK
jgi:hypothetical protein